MISINKKIFVFCLSFSILFLFSLGARAQIKPWNEIIASRFQFLSFSGVNNSAVLDRETGIIYDANTNGTINTWVEAMNACSLNTHAGKYGWRLPSVQELSNLLLSNYSGYGFRPPGNLWTSTTDPGDPNSAYTVDLYNNDLRSGQKANPLYYICVRGGN